MNYSMNGYSDPRWQQYEYYRYWDSYYRYYYGVPTSDRVYQDYNNYYYYYGHGYDWNYWKQMHDYYVGSYSSNDDQTRLPYHPEQYHDGYPHILQQGDTNDFPGTVNLMT